MPLIVCGKNSDEKDLFDLEIGIFDYAGVCLDMETQETFQGGIIIAATKEFWLLENGDFVIIQCIRYEGSLYERKNSSTLLLSRCKKGLNKRERSRAKRLQTIRKSVCSYV